LTSINVGRAAHGRCRRRDAGGVRRNARRVRRAVRGAAARP